MVVFSKAQSRSNLNPTSVVGDMPCVNPKLALGQPTSALTTSAPVGTVVPPSRLYREGAVIAVLLCANAGEAAAAVSSAAPNSACLVFMGGAPYLRASRTSRPDSPIRGVQNRSASE